MKVKRIFALLLSAAMLSAASVVPAFAEDGLFNETYDMTKVKPDGENGVVLEAEVPDGDYTVTVKTGGDTETKANVYINGGERVRAYTLEAGKTQDNEQPVVPKDGKISVQVIGEAPNVTEIDIKQLPAREEKGGKPTLYIAGDSTAQTYNYEKVYPQTGWGQVFDRFFTDDVIVENRSMGGRSSKSYNNDGRLDRILTEMHPGDYVFIQFGINDGAENKPERYISVEDYKKLITEKYIGEVEKRGGIPVLMTASAAAWWDEEKGNFMESRADYADPTRELAKELGCKFIDANRLMTDKINNSGLGKDEVLSGYFVCEPLESKAYPTGTNDTTHMKEKGAMRTAEVIANAIPEVLPELAKYLKGEEKFTDIDGHWGETEIKALADKGFVEGDGTGKFNPEGTVTRAEFLKMAMNACGIVGHAYREGECLDAANDDWYCYYLQGALDKGLIPYEMIFACEGTEQTEKVLAEATEDKEAVITTITTYKCRDDVKPEKMQFVNQVIKREEAAVIVMNCLSYVMKNAKEPMEITPFADNAAFFDSDIYEGYINSVDAAASYGIIQGMGDGTFAPKAALTRAQAAAVINRLANSIK